MKKLTLITAIILSSILTNAQTTFEKTYGGAYGNSVQQTTDGGYIVAGRTYSFGAGSEDVYLIKTNSIGDTLWAKTYGGTGYDYGKSVQQTTDGGYIVAGNTGSFGAGSRDVYLIKTNSTGDTLWTKTYGGTDYDEGKSVQQTTDGGYIVAGFTDSFGANGDVYLIKTNSTGDTLWTKTYGGTSSERGYFVQQTTDGGYIVAGYTYSFGAGSEDVYLIKTNSTGDTLWTKTFGGTTYDEGNSVQQTTDGGYIVAGYTDSFGAGGYDVYLIKTNSIGDTLWTKTYGGTSWDDGFSVQQTTDGGYIVVGYTLSFGAGNMDVYLIKTNSTGDTLWTKTYGGTNNDYGNSVQQTTDGGYIVAGRTESFGAGSRDVYLIKTDANGDTSKVTTISIQPPASSIKIQVYTNPSDGNFELEILNDEFQRQNIEVKVLNLLGQTVYQQTLNAKQETLNTKLTKGVYFLQLQSEQGVVSQKIVVQ